MTRPRKHNTHLPRGVYYNHGAYYKVTRGVWRRLCEKEEDIPAALAFLAPGHRRQIVRFVERLLPRARANAKGRRGIAFELTKDDVLPLLDACGWRCAVTHKPFSFEVIQQRKPFAPSIDRIDSAIGYVRDNCRLVCVAANFAMNVWGDAVLRRLMQP